MGWLNKFLVRIRRGPEFAAIFVITLALGVGANSALFSALRGYFLAPLPFPQANRLIVIQQKIGGSNDQISAATYEYLRDNAQSIIAGGLVHDAGGILTIGSGQAQKARLEAVTSSWFTTLDVQPFLGRAFGPDADKPGGPNEVVLSYSFWQNAMHGDRNVLGKTLMLNARSQTIVGVMPKGFYFASRQAKFWVPEIIDPADLTPDKVFDMSGRRFVARLRPGVSLATANAELNGLAERQLKQMSVGAQNHAKRQHYRIATMPLRTSLIGRVGTRLLLIELGAALLLLLTVAILANLVTVRTLARRHETALRVALGASRFDLWRAALNETLPLGLIGGVLALGLAWWGTLLIARYGIGTAGTAFSIAPDLWVVLFSLALGGTVGAIAALPAALSSRKRLLSRLSEGGRGGIGRRTRLAQRGLSVLQIALGVALMVNAALLGIAFRNASSHPIGVNYEHLVITDMGLHGPRFQNQSSQLNFYRGFGDAVRALPGIEQAGVASELPFAGGLDQYSINSVGGIETHGTDSVIEFVDGHALGALGVQLLQGRLIDSADVQEQAPVAVIDAKLARTLFGTANVIGRQIKMNQTYRVVGVIAPLLWHAQANSVTGGTMWLPYSVAPEDTTFYAGPDLDLAVRSKLPPQQVRAELDALLHKLAPQQAFSFVESMQTLKANAYHNDQAMPVLFGLFSLLALVLAGVGTYGTVAYLIRLRLGEFAVRQVLGATPTRIGLLALAQGAVLAIFGVGLGLVGGFILARTLSGLITDVGNTAALAYIVAAIVMALAALAATAAPALRAARTDLTALLRAQ